MGLWECISAELIVFIEIFHNLQNVYNVSLRLRVFSCLSSNNSHHKHCIKSRQGEWLDISSQYENSSFVMFSCKNTFQWTSVPWKIVFTWSKLHFWALKLEYLERIDKDRLLPESSSHLIHPNLMSPLISNYFPLMNTRLLFMSS